MRHLVCPRCDPVVLYVMTKARRPLPRSGRSSVSASPSGFEVSTQARLDDTFFRHIVAGMRNGVLAITRDGTLALINDEAYRIFGIRARQDDLGTPLSRVLQAHPDVVRVLMEAFDLHLLPNRVEMRLRPSNKVICERPNSGVHHRRHNDNICRRGKLDRRARRPA